MFDNIDPDYALLVGLIVVCGSALAYVIAICTPSIRRVENANNRRRQATEQRPESRQPKRRLYDPYFGHLGRAVITTFVTNLTGYGLNAKHFDIVRLAFHDRGEYLRLAEMVFSTTRRLGLGSIMNDFERESLVEELRNDEMFIMACIRNIQFLTEAVEACRQANTTVVTIPEMYIPNAAIVMAFHDAFLALRSNASAATA